jgi:beta-lactam-binding protein with PASTA domain
MPDLHCATVADATTQLAAVNLTLDAASSALSGGLFVVSTTPSAGQTLDGGTLVVLTTSATKPTDCP